ncbi:uncharacterized protein LOC126713926 isoform X2 [Quercus robur]|uniref:uncharacterized protein LOC126713926 isoform X2 n=1 Tax=Quercus robur TaxID=38942 RepID=UPI002163A843|nr:uncharacterized protein LOC126713926 isoform X2 [Quercus robur]
MKAISALARGGGDTVLCSHNHHFTLCNRLSFSPPIPNPTPNLTRSRPPIIITFFKPIPPKTHRFVLKAKAAESTQPASLSSSTTSADKTIVSDEEFSLAKVSFGVIGLGVGVSLLSYGFGAYFNILPGSEWSAIMLTYGFPLAIIGMALKYAELKPVPCLTYSEAQKLRETCATPILKQGGGIPRRSAPVLQLIREEVTEDGKYCLVLVFEAKALKLSDFEKRQEKFASFFGPGITAEVVKSEDNLYEVRLISNTNPNASP